LVQRLNTDLDDYWKHKPAEEQQAEDMAEWYNEKMLLTTGWEPTKLSPKEFCNEDKQV
jgi:hypothetical protein